MASNRERLQALGKGASIGLRAAQNGHELEVKHEGKRFRVRCSCGFQTALGNTRRTVFALAVEHASDAANEKIPKYPGVSSGNVGALRYS